MVWCHVDGTGGGLTPPALSLGRGCLDDLVSRTPPAQTPRQTKRKNASRPRQSTTPRLTYWIDKMVALLLIEVFEMADPGQTPSACKDLQ